MSGPDQTKPGAGAPKSWPLERTPAGRTGNGGAGAPAPGASSSLFARKGTASAQGFAHSLPGTGCVTPAAAKKILIVEDDALNMKLFHDLLAARGHTILQATDGREALELARAHHPDLILMDMRLPEVSGLRVTRWIRDDADLRSIPVIAVTAHVADGDEEIIRKGGCQDYISKPISVPGFVRTIEKFLR